ncbi:MAG: DnaJ domain-containing protein [Myxococcales bacterium]|nr:DnaJ domain-containing protein [Myxococcales bacterium]
MNRFIGSNLNPARGMVRRALAQGPVPGTLSACLRTRTACWACRRARISARCARRTGGWRRRTHPDQNGGSEASHESWIRVQVAYELLSDPDRRSRLDLGGQDASKLMDDELARRRAQLARRRVRLRRLYE